MITPEKILEKLDQLKGVDAHNEVMSYPRPSADYALENLTPKLSAVMCLFFPSNEGVRLVLMERTKGKSTHSGQISFPGGRYEKTDTDFQHTALRETEEEMGISADSIEVLGSLSALYIPPSNFVVYPFIGWLNDFPEFTPEVAEVANIYTPIASDFLSDNNFKSGEIFIPKYKQNIAVKYFDLEGLKVWGATAMMLQEVKHLLNGLI